MLNFNLIKHKVHSGWTGMIWDHGVVGYGNKIQRLGQENKWGSLGIIQNLTYEEKGWACLGDV